MLQIAVSQPGQRVLLTLILTACSSRLSATAAGTAHGFAPRAIQIQGTPAQYSIKHGQEVGHRAPVEILHGHGAAKANKKQTVFSPLVRPVDLFLLYYSSMWTNFPRGGRASLVLAGLVIVAIPVNFDGFQRLLLVLDLQSNRQGMRCSTSRKCVAVRSQEARPNADFMADSEGVWLNGRRQKAHPGRQHLQRNYKSRGRFCDRASRRRRTFSAADRRDISDRRGRRATRS